MYGQIEGSYPKRYYHRERGNISLDLSTSDIEGAQSGTKGLGMFSKITREEIRNPIMAQDIEGAQAGTLKKGVSSNRRTNPINPDYQELGGKQNNLRPDMVYAEPVKYEIKPRRPKQENANWKKSTVIPIIEDRKLNTSAIVKNTNSFYNAANVLFL